MFFEKHFQKHFSDLLKHMFASHILPLSFDTWDRDHRKILMSTTDNINRKSGSSNFHVRCNPGTSTRRPEYNCARIIDLTRISCEQEWQAPAVEHVNYNDCVRVEAVRRRDRQRFCQLEKEYGEQVARDAWSSFA